MEIKRKYYIRDESQPYLDMGELNFLLPTNFIEICKQYNFQKLKFYPNRLELAKKLKTNILGPGSEYLINKIIQYVPSQKVLFFNPAWSMYKTYSIINKKDYEEIDIESFYNNPIEKLVKKSKKGDLVIISNPDSIFGHYLDKLQLSTLLSALDGRFIIIDQAYLEFLDINFDYDYFLNKFDNLYFTRTFSKAYSLPGIRLGYCYTNDKNFNYYLDYFPISDFSIFVALKALESNITEFVKKVQQQKLKMYNIKNKFVPSNLYYFHIQDNHKKLTNLSTNLKYVNYKFDNNTYCLLSALPDNLLEIYLDLLS